MQVKVLRPSNFDSVPLSTVRAQERAGQQKVTWSHIPTASFKFISRPTRHVPINYLNLPGKGIIVNAGEATGWPAWSELALRGSHGAVPDPQAPDTPGSHLHPATLLCFRSQQSGNSGVLLYPFVFH